MKKLLFLASLVAALKTGHAQVDSVKKPTACHSFWKMLGEDFRIRFPEADFIYYIPNKNKSFLDFPGGADKLLYDRLPEMACAFFLPKNNISFRWLGLFYKDRIGFEAYLDEFGADIDLTRFEQYLDQQFPGHYNTSGSLGYTPLYFTGARYGLAYIWHWKGFLAEPTFQLGFEHLNSWPDRYRYRDNNSNQFIEYRVSEIEKAPLVHSCRFQLQLARRFKTAKGHYYEVGGKAEYLWAPYEGQMTVQQMPYGAAPTVWHLNIRETYKMWGYGVYMTYLLNK